MKPQVIIQTELGDIELEIDNESAPRTSENFLRYVDEGFYNGGSFYRTVIMANQPDNLVKIEVIQGGNRSTEVEKSKHSPITLERTSVTGLRHKNGTLSMARFEADSATSEFFICIGDQPELDFGGARNPDGQGFAAFGRVTKGEDIVQKIHMRPVEAQTLTPEIKIISIQRKA